MDLFGNIFRSMAPRQQPETEPETGPEEQGGPPSLNDSTNATAEPAPIVADSPAEEIEEVEMNLNPPLHSVVDADTSDDDYMPPLEDVSDSDSDDYSDSDVDEDNSSDMEASEVQYGVVPTAGDDDDDVMPGLEPIDPLPTRANRRVRLDDDHDEDRDRRHPSQRLRAAPGASTPFRAPSETGGPSAGQQPPDGDRVVITFDFGTGPIQIPVGDATGAARDRPALFPLNLQALFGDLFGVPEQDDPERAKILVDGLEEVPVGLVRRLEQVGDVGGADDTGGSGGDAGCAICWDKLLDGDGEQFGHDNDVDSKETHSEPSEDSNGPAGASPRGAGLPSNEVHPEVPSAPSHPKVVALPCAHVFHASCLIPWFSRPRQTTCPTCRFNIDPENLTHKRRRQGPPATGPVGDASSVAEEQTAARPPGARPSELINQMQRSIDSAREAREAGQSLGEAVERLRASIDALRATSEALGQLVEGVNNAVAAADVPVNQVANVSGNDEAPESAANLPEQRTVSVDLDGLLREAEDARDHLRTLQQRVQSSATPREVLDLRALLRRMRERAAQSLEGLNAGGSRTQPANPSTSVSGPQPGGPSSLNDNVAMSSVPSSPVNTTAPAPATRAAPTPPDQDGQPDMNDIVSFGFDLLLRPDGSTQVFQHGQAGDGFNTMNQPGLANGQGHGQLPPEFITGMAGSLAQLFTGLPGAATTIVPIVGGAAQPPRGRQPNVSANMLPHTAAPSGQGAPGTANGPSRLNGLNGIHPFTQQRFGHALRQPGGPAPATGTRIPRPANPPLMPGAGVFQIGFGPFPIGPRMPGGAAQTPHTSHTPLVPPLRSNPPLNTLPFPLFPPPQHAARAGQTAASDPPVTPADTTRRPASPPPSYTPEAPPTSNAPAQPFGAGPQPGPPHFPMDFVEVVVQPIAFGPAVPAEPRPTGSDGTGAALPTGNIDPGTFENLFEGPFPMPRRPSSRPPSSRQASTPKKWTIPPPPGATLRERIEKKEREKGLRCYLPSCDHAPDDEYPVVQNMNLPLKQVHIVGEGEGNACDHTFHTSCLASAQRVALQGADPSIHHGKVEVSCPVCKADGTVSDAEWEEGVHAFD